MDGWMDGWMYVYAYWDYRAVAQGFLLNQVATVGGLRLREDLQESQTGVVPQEGPPQNHARHK